MSASSGAEPDTHPDDQPTDEVEPVVTFPFAVDPLFAVASRPFGVTPGNALVEVHHDRVVARFGPWRVATPLTNIAAAEVTGPYTWFKVIGPAHLSVIDRGLTFATTSRRGVCLRFHEPVRGLDPFGLVRHPGLTVTVAEPHVLAELLDRAGHGDHAARHGTVTAADLASAAGDELTSLSAAELRQRATERGLDGVSSMSKAELLEVLAPDLEVPNDVADDTPADPSDT